MEAAQYLWTLLTDQHQNFTKWALFGCTWQDFDHGGHLTSIEANPLNRHFWPNWHQILKGLHKSTHHVKKQAENLKSREMKDKWWKMKDEWLMMKIPYENRRHHHLDSVVDILHCRIKTPFSRCLLLLSNLYLHTIFSRDSDLTSSNVCK